MVAIFNLLYPRAVGFVSTSAFVNAPIISVRVPFDGVIEAPSKKRAGSLKAGETLLELEASRDSRLELIRLQARSDALNGRLSAIDTQIASLSALSKAFNARYRDIQNLAARLVDSRYAQALASRAAAESSLALLTARRDRAKKLAERRIVAQAEVQDLEFEIARATAELNRADAVLGALDVEAEAVKDYGFDGEVATAVPYYSQRMDEIGIRIVDLEAERERVVSELASLAPVAKEIERTLETVDRFSPVAPADSLVWHPSPGANSTLVAGEEAMQILDCTRRFVEVTFRERHFDQIRKGSIARVQLKGTDTYFTAPVSSLRGAGNDGVDQRLSAIERSRAAPDLTLYLDIPEPDPAEPAIASAFCDVGRSAEVRIQRQSFSRLFCRWQELLGGACETTSPQPAPTTAHDLGDRRNPHLTGG